VNINALILEHIAGIVLNKNMTVGIADAIFIGKINFYADAKIVKA